MKIFKQIHFYSLSLFIICLISQIHSSSSSLRSLPIERILLLLSLLSGSINFCHKRPSQQFFYTALFSWTLAMSPLLSSLLSFHIHFFEEYKSFLKTLIILPFIVEALKDHKRQFLNIFHAGYFILGITFLYRYLYLGETREFDGRPLLNIKNGDPNFLCTFFGMYFFILIYEILENFKKIQTMHKFILTTLFSMNLFVIFLTQSRMGIISLIVSTTFVFIVSDKKIGRNSFIPIIIAFTTFFIFKGPELISRFKDISDKSNSDRILTLKNGLMLYIDNPLLGVGMGKAKDSYFVNTHYPPFQSQFSPLEVHNTTLEIMSELGTFGLIICAAFFLSIVGMTNFSQKKIRGYPLGLLLFFLMMAQSIGLVYKDLIYINLIAILILWPSPRFYQSKESLI